MIASARSKLAPLLARLRSADGPFTRALGAGLAAAAACGSLWAALAAATERDLGFAAVGLGAAVAYAMRLASGGLREPRLLKAAAGCTLFGFLFGKFVLVARAMRELTENSPDRPPDLHLSFFGLRMLKFFAIIFPRMLTAYDALWLCLALAAAWLILKPARRI